MPLAVHSRGTLDAGAQTTRSMMRSGSQLKIAVLPGDGIGAEVMDACLTVLDALSRRTLLRFDWKRLEGGANAYRGTGNAFTDYAMQECERADAILFGAMGLHDVRYPDGTEIAPQLDIRTHIERCALYPLTVPRRPPSTPYYTLLIYWLLIPAIARSPA